MSEVISYELAVLGWGFPMQGTFFCPPLPGRVAPQDLHARPHFPEALGGIDSSFCVSGSQLLEE